MSEPFYAPHQLAELQEGYYAINRTYEQLLGEYLSLRLTSEAAYEYARHGFVRRPGTLKARVHGRSIFGQIFERSVNWAVQTASV
jgi:hypothetical protein